MVDVNGVTRLTVFTREAESCGDAIARAVRSTCGEIVNMWYGGEYSDEDCGWHIEIDTRDESAVEAVFNPYHTDIDYGAED